MCPGAGERAWVSRARAGWLQGPGRNRTALKGSGVVGVKLCGCGWGSLGGGGRREAV